MMKSKILASLTSLGAVVNGFAGVWAETSKPQPRFTKPTPARRSRRFKWKDGTVRGFPGAKLIRKAQEGRIGLATIR
jgi:hypothetical protein